jgi:hypothetical protein
MENLVKNRRQPKSNSRPKQNSLTKNMMIMLQTISN